MRPPILDPGSHPPLAHSLTRCPPAKVLANGTLYLESPLARDLAPRASSPRPHARAPSIPGSFRTNPHARAPRPPGSWPGARAPAVHPRLTPRQPLDPSGAGLVPRSGSLAPTLGSLGQTSKPWCSRTRLQAPTRNNGEPAGLESCPRPHARTCGATGTRTRATAHLRRPPCARPGTPPARLLALLRRPPFAPPPPTLPPPPGPRRMSAPRRRRLHAATPRPAPPRAGSAPPRPPRPAQPIDVALTPERRAAQCRPRGSGDRAVAKRLEALTRALVRPSPWRPRAVTSGAGLRSLPRLPAPPAGSWRHCCGPRARRPSLLGDQLARGGGPGGRYRTLRVLRTPSDAAE